MRASKFEFRLRGLILTLIVVVGFWAPWLQALDMSKRVSLLEWLALELSRIGVLRFTYATPVVIIAGAVLSAIGMVLRVTGTAYLGSGIVHDANMQGSELISSGPFRYVRNPLYLGGWCMVAAICLLMPPTGALITMLLVTLFYLRLIFAEELFLECHLGAVYQHYRRMTPRFAPRLRTNLPGGTARREWLLAALAEVFSIGTFFTLAVLAWTYDNLLMIKAILISFGLSLVTQAVVMGKSRLAESNSDLA